MNVVKKKFMEYEWGLSWPFILPTNQRNINVESLEMKMIFFLQKDIDGRLQEIKEKLDLICIGRRWNF